MKPWKDTRNVYVKKVEEPFSAARLMTAETKRPVAGYFWSRDSKFILFAKDHDGDVCPPRNLHGFRDTISGAWGGRPPPGKGKISSKAMLIFLQCAGY